MKLWSDNHKIIFAFYRVAQSLDSRGTETTKLRLGIAEHERPKRHHRTGANQTQRKKGIVFLLPVDCYFLKSNTFVSFSHKFLCFPIWLAITKNNATRKLMFRELEGAVWSSSQNKSFRCTKFIHLDQTVVFFFKFFHAHSFQFLWNNRSSATSKHSPLRPQNPGNQFLPLFLAILEVSLVQSFPRVPDFRHEHHVHTAWISLGYKACHVFRADRQNRRKTR